MAEIVWLASYPKSGNTWFRALLTNYLEDADEPATIDRLRGVPIAGARSWFDTWSGIEASALDDASIERLRPQVYRSAAAQAAETLYLKVHEMWYRTDCGEPLFPSDATAAVIYLVRNPLDLVSSFANHGNTDNAAVTERLCRPGYERWQHARALGEQLPQRLGSWTEHVRSWTEESGLPVCVVRYEDLLHTPEETFTRALRTCGLKADERRVAKAVAFSRFEQLRGQESSTASGRCLPARATHSSAAAKPAGAAPSSRRHGADDHRGARRGDGTPRLPPRERRNGAVTIGSQQRVAVTGWVRTRIFRASDVGDLWSMGARWCATPPMPRTLCAESWLGGEATDRRVVGCGSPAGAGARVHYSRSASRGTAGAGAWRPLRADRRGAARQP